MTLNKMLAAESNPHNDGKDVWLKDTIAMGHRHFWVTPEEVGERHPLVSEQGGCVIVSNARLDNRDELVRTLGANVGSSDAQLILEAYMRWGEDCPGHLLGDFAFILWDPAKQQLAGCAGCPRGGRPGISYPLKGRSCLPAVSVCY